MGRGPHEAGGMFDETVELRPNGGQGDGLVKGRALHELPLTRSSSDEQYIDNLEVGRR
jgi:hypothetical protein